MKEIGIKLKEKREDGGLSISEVAEDLKVEVSDIDSLESGYKDNFSDIYVLKDLISSYAKYLGLDSEKLLNEFNEYMFSQTSRISLEDIKKARDESDSNSVDTITSPYTKINKNRKKVIVSFILIFLFLLFIFFISYFIVNNYFTTDGNISGDVSYVIGGE